MNIMSTFTNITNNGINISISATVHLTSPNPTLTLTCYQSTVVGVRGGIGRQFLRY